MKVVSFQRLMLSGSAWALMLGDELGIEAMSNAVWCCDEGYPCVDWIVTVSLGQFQVIRQSVKKTDRDDARALAFFLSRGMLPGIRLKSVTGAGLASRVQTRDGFVKSSTLLLNRIHALYNRRRTKLKKEGLTSRKKPLALDSSQFTPFECVRHDVLREQTLNLTIALTKLGNAIEGGFASADKLAAYIGIVPRVSQSNPIGNRERITK